MVTDSQALTLLTVIKVFTIAAGLFIVYVAFRSYQRRPQRTMFWMMLGILFLTLGAVTEGLAVQGLNWAANESHLFEAVVTLVGFAVLLYSLYVK